MKTLRLLIPVALLCLVFQGCVKDDSNASVIAEKQLRAEATNSIDLSHIDFRELFANYDLSSLNRGSDIQPAFTADEFFLPAGESKLHRNHHKVTVNFSA
jgi:hypothetical protein